MELTYSTIVGYQAFDKYIFIATPLEVNKNGVQISQKMTERQFVVIVSDKNTVNLVELTSMEPSVNIITVSFEELNSSYSIECHLLRNSYAEGEKQWFTPMITKWGNELSSASPL